MAYDPRLDALDKRFDPKVWRGEMAHADPRRNPADKRFCFAFAKACDAADHEEAAAAAMAEADALYDAMADATGTERKRIRARYLAALESSHKHRRRAEACRRLAGHFADATARG